MSERSKFQKEHWILAAATALALAAYGVSVSAAALTANATTPPSLPRPGSYAIDPAHTFVYWAAQHKVVGKVRGRFDRMSGTIVVATDTRACSINVAIEAASLSTQNHIRDEDVQGPDFFDAKNFPMITYRGTGIRRAGDGWVIDGVLTIRGITKTVPLRFRFGGSAPAEPGKPERVAFHATAQVQREEFGMTRELLMEIGSRSARPDVWIEIDAEALTDTPKGP